MKCYFVSLKKFATFRGRATRSEYWYFVLSMVVFAIGTLLIDIIIGTYQTTGYCVIYPLFLVAMVFPSISVAVRKLHDTGRSGWLYLIGSIPIVGALVIRYFLVQDSQPGTNRYEPNSKLAKT